MKIRIKKPINTHGHLREGAIQRPLIEYGEEAFDTVFAMTNTQEGALTAAQAIKYGKEARRHAKNLNIVVVMMANENTDPKEIREASRAGIKHVKFLPKFRTTFAHYGVLVYSKLDPVLAEIEKEGMYAHFHPEHPNKVHGDREAEYMFLAIFEQIRQRFPNLKMVWEHCSDGRVIPALKQMPNVGIGITAHHLFANDTQVYGRTASGVMRPPIRTEWDRQELARLATSSFACVFAGLDDAPHSVEKKSDPTNCCCGVYTAPFGTLLYASIFDELLSLEDSGGRLNKFMSRNACKFFGLPEPKEWIEIERGEYTIPGQYDMEGTIVVPFMPGEKLNLRYA